MQVEQEVGNGVVDGLQFRVKDNDPFAFKVLSNNLYSRKIEAVIRELSTNAADEHKRLGKDIPFEVSLPTYTDNRFTIRDFGEGLSHDDMQNMYISFFSSTKRNDNAVDGCLGLGSKSPFAVASEYQVTSWHNGVKNIYKCNKQNGIPTIKHIHSEPSDEPSGLQITLVPNDENRYPHEWKNSAERVYKFFSLKPSVNVDLNMDIDESLLFGEKWSFHEGLRENYAVMGNVAYKIDFSSIYDSEDSDFLQDLRSINGLILRFELGDFNFTPNREELDYNEKTRQCIILAVKKMVEDLLSSISNSIADCSDLYHARVAFLQRRDYLLRMFDARLSNGIHAKVRKMNLKFRNQKLFDNDNLAHLLTCFSRAFVYTKNEKNRITGSEKNEVVFNYLKHPLMYYYEGKKQKGRVRKELMKDESESVAMLMSLSDARNFLAIIGYEGDINNLIKPVDSLPAATSFSIRTAKHEIDRNGVRSKQEGVIDQDDEVYYVIRNRNEFLHSGHRFSFRDLNTMIRALFPLGELPSHIISITPSEAKRIKVEEADNMEEFIPFLLDKSVDFLNSKRDSIEKFLMEKKILKDLNENFVTFFTGWYGIQADLKGIIESLVEDHPLKKIIPYLNESSGNMSQQHQQYRNEFAKVYSLFTYNMEFSQRKMFDTTNISIAYESIYDMGRFENCIQQFNGKIKTNIYQLYIAWVDLNPKCKDQVIKTLNQMYQSGLMPQVIWEESEKIPYEFKANFSPNPND